MAEIHGTDVYRSWARDAKAEDRFVKVQPGEMDALCDAIDALRAENAERKRRDSADTELDLAWVADHHVISAVAKRVVLDAAAEIDALRAEVKSLKSSAQASNAEAYQLKAALFEIAEALPGYEAQVLAKTNGDAQHWDTSDTVDAAIAAINDLDGDVKTRERAARVHVTKAFVAFVVASCEFNNGDFYADGKVDETDLDALAERFTALEVATDGE